MSNKHNPTHDADQPMAYQIRIKGHLSPRWNEWFAGLTITLEEDGYTLLNGPVVDQSALHGILKKIRDLGMPLLSLNHVDSNKRARADTDQVEGGV
jgi:hypothetical protein